MMETPGIPSTRWFDATLLPKEQVSQKDNLKAMFVMGHGGNTVTRIPEASERRRQARPAGRRRSGADHLGRAWATARTNTYLLPVCHQLRGGRLAHRLEPLAPVGRADRQADLRVEGRQRDHVPAGEEARLRRQDVQEHQGREQRAGRRGHPARDQSRRLVDRLLRPVAGAPQAAHGQPEGLRSGHAAGERRALQGRLLRPAVAVLGHAGAQASRHPHALQHQPACHGRRRHVPRPLRRGARRQDQGDGGREGGRAGGEAQPAGRRLLLAGLRDQGRLSRVHLRRAQEARLGHGPDRRGARNHRADRRRQSRCGLLGDRSVGRHSARRA